MKCLLALALFAASATTTVFGGEAAPKQPAAPAAAKKKQPARQAVQGIVKAIDKTAMTLSVESKGKLRTIHMTSRTRLSKAGQPATFGDAAVGDEVTAQIQKNASGEEEAISLRLGAKAESKKAAKGSQKPPSKKD
ncbi:MAG: hypothetical protein HY735_37505 [Verrucomicrobia bacterium]|nr:hypothetical protein [Verrucomicrobiota bacterium]